MAAAFEDPLSTVAPAFKGLTVSAPVAQVTTRAEYRLADKVSAFSGHRPVEQVLHLDNRGSTAALVPLSLTQRIPAVRISFAGRWIELPDKACAAFLTGSASSLEFSAMQGQQLLGGRYDWSDVAGLPHSVSAWREGDEGVVQLDLQAEVAARSERVIDPSLDMALSSSYNVDIEGAASLDAAGSAVAVGDLNGDGIDDLAFSATGTGNSGRSGSGSVYVVYGGPLSFTAGTGQMRDILAANAWNVRFDGPTAGQPLGSALAIVDLNNDGHKDLVMGSSASSSGTAWVVYGGALTFTAVVNQARDMAASANWNVRFDGAAPGYKLGSALGSGDLNGDGKPDLLISSPGAGFNSLAASGSVYVIQGGSSIFAAGSGHLAPLSTLSNFNERFDGIVLNCGLADAIGTGDLNGDGTADLALGAVLANTASRTNNGALWVIYGGATNFPSSTGNLRALTVTTNFNVRLDGPLTVAQLGKAIAIGDINGDSIPDLGVSAPQNSSQGRNENGSIFTLYGGTANFPAGTGQTRDLTVTASFSVRFDGETSFGLLGNGQGVAGIIDSVGGTDMAFGSFDESPLGRSLAGSVYVLRGQGTLFPVGTPVVQVVDLAGNPAGLTRFDAPAGVDELGNALAVGDLNNDAVPDLVMGASRHSGSSRSQNGGLFVAYGNAALYNYSPTDTLTVTPTRTITKTFSVSPTFTVTPSITPTPSQTQQPAGCYPLAPARVDSRIVLSGCFSTTNNVAYSNPGGSNTLLVLRIEDGSSSVPTTALYGGSVLTPLRQDSSYLGGELATYFLLSPPSGSNTLSITMPAANCDWNVAVEVYSGVDLAAPFGGSSSVTGTSSTIIDSVTSVGSASVLSDFMAVAQVYSASELQSMGPGQSNLNLVPGCCEEVMGAYKDTAGAGLQAMQYNMASARQYSSQLIEIKGNDFCNGPSATASPTVSLTQSPDLSFSPTPNASPTSTVTSICPLGSQLGWSPGTALPVAGGGLPCTAPVYGNDLFLVGGDGPLSSLWQFDTVGQSWTSLPPLSQARARVAVGQSPSLIYAAGGGDGSGGYFHTFEVYDLGTNTWSLKAPLPTARERAAGVVFNNKFYVMGGNNGAPMSTNEAFNISNQLWETGLTPLPAARSYPAVAAANGKIYVIGGTASNGAATNTVYQYDPLLDSWALKSPMNVARDSAAVTVQNGLIYVMGGYAPSTGLTAFESYDPVADHWTVLPSLNVPRYDLAGAVVNGVFYALGGYDGNQNNTAEKAGPQCVGTATASPTATVSPTAVPAAVACGGSLVLDGLANEALWSGQWRPFSKVVVGSTTVTGKFQLAWDSSNMYVAVQVTDPALYSNGAQYYNDDTVELYFDSNHTRTGTYVIGDDFQYSFNWNNPVVQEENGQTTGVLHATSVTAGGYSMEMAIPWTTLGKVPSNGLTVGFDVAVDDDANGDGLRDGQIIWSGDATDYNNPQKFGAFILSSLCGTATQTITPSLSPSPSPTASPTPCALNVTAFNSLIAGTYNYCSVHIFSGGTLSINGLVTLNVSGDFTIDSGGFVSGDGGGSTGGTGTGPGMAGQLGTPQGGGGGGHGGPGGQGGSPGATGGGAYGSASSPIELGSGGGTGGNFGAPGAPGGGALQVIATGNATLNGQLHSAGTSAAGASANNTGAPGGGAGGSIYIRALNISGSGVLTANGGAGGNCGAFTPCNGGGGGGGGRIALSATGLCSFSGTSLENPGLGGSSGGTAGFMGSGQICVPTPTPTFSGTPSVTPSLTPSASATPSATVSPTSACPLGTQLGWSLGPHIPSSREGLATTAPVFGNDIYLVGGDGPVSTVQKLNASTQTWTSMAPLPLALERAAVGQDAGFIYVAGGGDGASGFYNNFEVYDVGAGTWSAKTPLPTARVRPSGVVYNNKFYVIAGMNAVTLTANESYDIGTQAWTTGLAPLPAGRSGAAIAAINGKIYVMGGSNGTIVTNSVYQYDISLDSWSVKAPMNAARDGAGTIVQNGLIYVLGGYGSGGPTGAVESYDPVADAWTVLTSMNVPRNAMAAAAVNGTFYTLGGYDAASNWTVEVGASQCVGSATVTSSPSNTPQPSPTPTGAPNTVYREVFPNNTGADIDLSTSGWVSNQGPTGVTMPDVAVGGLECSLQPGDPVGLAPLNSLPGNAELNNGFLADSSGVTGRQLYWTSEYTVSRSAYDLSDIRWSQGNSLAACLLSPAVRVGGSWYVATSTFGNPGVGSGSQFQFGTSAGVAFEDFQAPGAQWQLLNFTVGSVLALSGGPIPLPAGDITAFGLYSDNKTGAVRFDCYEIVVQPHLSPTPTSTPSPTATASPTVWATTTPFAVAVWDDMELGQILTANDWGADTTNAAAVTSQILSAAGAHSGSLGRHSVLNTGNSSAWGVVLVSSSPYGTGPSLGYRDLTGATTLEFWVRSSVNCLATMAIQEAGSLASPVNGADGENYTLGLPPLAANVWTHVRIPLAWMGRGIYAGTVGNGVLDLGGIQTVNLQIGGNQGASVTIDWDDISFIGPLGAASTPTPVPARVSCAAYDVMGSGAANDVGFGGDARYSAMAGVLGLVTDGVGGFFACPQDSRVVHVSASGIVTLVAGNGVGGFNGLSGSAPAIELNGPRALAYDAAHNWLYVAEANGNYIRKIDVGAGTISTIAGTGAASYSGDGSPAIGATFNQPRGLALDGSNNLYVADFSNNRVRKIDLIGGNITLVAGNGSTTYNGEGTPLTRALNNPNSIDYDPLSNALLIGEENGSRVRRIPLSAGSTSTLIGTGTQGYNGDGIAATSAQVNFVRDVKVGPNNMLYIADYNNQRVRSFSLAGGNVSTVLGTGSIGWSLDGGPATSCLLHGAMTLAISSSGDLYASNYFNNMVELVPACFGPTPTPTFTGTATPSPTSSPTPTNTGTPSSTMTATPSPTATPTGTGTPTSTATPTPSNTATPTFTATPSQTATPTPSNTATPTSTPTPSQTATPTPSNTATPTFTATPSQTATPTPSNTATPTFTATPSQTASPTPSATATPSSSATPTSTGTPTPTVTATPTDTATPSSTATPSQTATGTSTGTPTPTVTATPTNTATPSSTVTATLSDTATATPTGTATSTSTVTPTPTLTGTMTLTATDSATQTPTATPTPSATLSNTPSSTATPSQSATLSVSPTLTSTPTTTPSSTDTPSVTVSASFTDTPTTTVTVTPSMSSTSSATPSGTRTPSPSFTDSPTVTPLNSVTFSSTRTITLTPTQTALPTDTSSVTPSVTQTLFVTDTPSPTITLTWTPSNTPLPTGTAVVPAVLSKNLFRPSRGERLDISFKALQDGFVTVRVFNVAGEKVREPYAAQTGAGLWVDCPWDGRNAQGQWAGDGIYIVSIQGGGIRRLMKVVLLK